MSGILSKRKVTLTAKPSVPALTTTGQLEETSIFERALHFTDAIQFTEQYFKLAPRFTIRYYCKGLDLIVLQLEWLDEVAGMHRCEHGEDDRFFRTFPKDIMTEIVNRYVTDHKTADIDERLKLLKGDSGIETPKI
jgi:hypothetical protein